MEMGEFFLRHREPSYVVLDEDGRAHYGRRPRVVELLVPMCCKKCQEKVRENMLELEGVQGVDVHPTAQRVTVTGFVDPMKTLKKARRVHRDSQLLAAESHLLPSPVIHTHQSAYRHRPLALQASPASSATVVHHPPVSTYRTSYAHHIPQSNTEMMMASDPFYFKHAIHRGYRY